MIIGDEILTGKVRDANGPLLIDLCRDLGVCLERLVYIPDDIEVIAAEVRSCSEQFDAVITSGGVGPTHDDRTVAAVAHAFGVAVERHPELEAMIRAWWGKRFTVAALRMADMPEGSRLLYGDDGLLPLVVFRNIYLIPGVPRLFEADRRPPRRDGGTPTDPEVRLSEFGREQRCAVARPGGRRVRGGQDRQLSTVRGRGPPCLGHRGGNELRQSERGRRPAARALPDDDVVRAE